MPYLDSSIPSLPFSDHDTSKQAAERMEPHADTKREQYFRWLLARGSYGATDAEAEHMPMKRQSICARRNELIAAGRVFKSAVLRRNGMAVWIGVRE